jgi:hypothetical protein
VAVFLIADMCETPAGGCSTVASAPGGSSTPGSHNESEIMSAPTQVGVLGDGDTEVGAALSGESGPVSIIEQDKIKSLLITLR